MGRSLLYQNLNHRAVLFETQIRERLCGSRWTHRELCAYDFEFCIYLDAYLSKSANNDLLTRRVWSYGVASISRLLKIIGLFCRVSSLL